MSVVGLLRALILALGLGAPSLAFSSALVDFSPELLQRVEAKWGANAAKRLQALRNLVEQNQDMDEQDKLKLVNDFFNLVPYYTDMEHWGVEDYWATPFEKLTTFGGDCEDYSIAKYFTLRELGVDDGKMRITYVKALDWDQAHMVLTYAPNPRVGVSVYPHHKTQPFNRLSLVVVGFSQHSLVVRLDDNNTKYRSSSNSLFIQAEDATS